MYVVYKRAPSLVKVSKGTLQLKSTKGVLEMTDMLMNFANFKHIKGHYATVY